MLLIPIISELGEKPSKAVRHYMRGARCETRMRVYAVRDLEITRTVIQSYSSHCTLYMHVMHPYTFYFLSTFFTFVRIYMHMYYVFAFARSISDSGRLSAGGSIGSKSFPTVE